MKPIIYILIDLYVFYIFYLAIMSLYRAKLNNTITRTSLIVGYPILVVGALIDCLLNITLFSIIFLEKPRELLLTKRMQRYVRLNAGWRYQLSEFICKRLLNPFDPSGKHC